MSDPVVLTNIVVQRILTPILLTAGIVGNLLNIAVLTRRALCRHPCSRYFLAMACNNVFCSALALLQNILLNGYQISLSNKSTASCKIYTYISSLSSFLSPYFIVLASIDRCCTSSRNVNIRKFTNVRIAHRIIAAVIAFFALLFIHILVLTDISAENGFNCMMITSTAYSQGYIIFQVFLFAVVPPATMLTLGLITIKQATHSRIAPTIVSRFNRTDKQLARMLLIQVGAHILLTLPTSVSYLIRTLPNNIRTTPTFQVVSMISSFLFNCSFVIPFFSYLLSGRIYRDELIRLARKLFTKSNANRTETSVALSTIRAP